MRLSSSSFMPIPVSLTWNNRSPSSS
jgi:hypothetical protein